MKVLVQLANFYGPESGGLRTALEHLGRGYRGAGVDRYLIVPGATDGEEVTPAGVRIIVASPHVPGAHGYRALTNRRRVATILRALRPDRVEVSDKLTLGWVGRWAASRAIPSVLLSHERIDAILGPHFHWLAAT